MMDYVFNSSATTKHFIEIAVLCRIRVCRAHAIILMIFKKNLHSQMRKSDALSWFLGVGWGGVTYLFFKSCWHESSQLRQTVIYSIPTPFFYDLAQRKQSKNLRVHTQKNYPSKKITAVTHMLNSMV